MDRPKGVLFDLDGTLLDTLRDLADSGNAVLRSRGLPVHPVESYRTFIGRGMTNLVRDIFPEGRTPAEGEGTERVLVEYREAYARNWRNTTVPYPGIPELLDSLRSRGTPIGVLSNKAHDFTGKCVDAFLSDWSWDVVLGAREGVPTKPDPTGAIEAAAALGLEPGECCFIGDSDVDMFTAVNAEMLPVGVGWGFRSVDELRGAGAKVILEAPGDLLELVT